MPTDSDATNATCRCPHIKLSRLPLSTRYPALSLPLKLTMDGSQFAASYVKHHLPYFTPFEVEKLSDNQRGKLSITQEEKVRQQAGGFIESVGAKIGLYVFPRRC